MASKMFEVKRAKPNKFQALFLRNDSGEEVLVHEVKQVDFLTVQEHLSMENQFSLQAKAHRNLNRQKQMPS
jgi:hypothetical protein